MTKCCFISEEYHLCGKQGHIAWVCRSAPGKNPPPIASSKEVKQLSEEPVNNEYSLFPVLSSNSKPLLITVLVEGHKLTMEIDTGVAVLIVIKDTMNSLPLQQTDLSLCTYSGQPVSVLGQLFVKVQHNEAQETIPLQAVKGEIQHYWGETGSKIFTRLENIFKLHTLPTLQEVLDNCKQVFIDELDHKAKFYLEEQAKPQFLKTRQLPLTLYVTGFAKTHHIHTQWQRTFFITNQ